MHRIVANKSMQEKHWPLPEHWKNTQTPMFSMSNTVLQHEGPYLDTETATDSSDIMHCVVDTTAHH